MAIFSQDSASAYLDKAAEALDAMGTKIDVVLDIEVPDEAIVERMSGRRVCTCGASDHIAYKPSKKEGICDKCGKELFIRPDDKAETVRHRLAVYHETTEVLKSFYENLGRLRLVNGSQSIEGAFEDILKVIGAKA